MQRYKSKQKLSEKLFLLTIVVVYLTLSSHAVMANDYLNELASEAEATANVSRKSQLNAAEKKQQKEMETLLSEKKPSTYKFYVKLNTKNKQYAYEQWVKDQSKSDERLHHLQKKVMDLYFSQ